MALGLAAMYVHDFRILLQIFSGPGLLIFLYIWLVESYFTGYLIR